MWLARVNVTWAIMEPDDLKGFLVMDNRTRIRVHVLMDERNPAIEVHVTHEVRWRRHWLVVDKNPAFRTACHHVVPNKTRVATKSHHFCLIVDSVDPKQARPWINKGYIAAIPA